MPCSKSSITKTYTCDKDGCLCIPTNGAARVCLSVNETGNIVRCNCECDTKCECNENCICINTAGLTCICVCRDQNGRIKTCEDCSCHPKQAQSCKGKGNVTCCCNTGNEKCACLNCSCCEPGKNKCVKGSCVTICKAKKAYVCARKACSENCKCQGNANSCVCICKNKQGETVCCDDCKCEGNKTCDKKECICVRKESASVRNCKCQGNSNSCVCVCKDKQGKNVCCDDCKCDGDNRCDKEGCVCIRKESTSELVKLNCCENCDGKCKCSYVEQNADIKAKNCALKACRENCKCQGNATSCVCICKNKQGETVCCDDCKCDNNNICDKKECVCVPKEDSCKGQHVKPNCCENCVAKCKCCVDQGAFSNANSCAGKVCAEDCKCKGNENSCVCICKDKQGKSICCDDCKCDGNNTCDKKGCVCVPRETMTCKSGCSCRNAVRSCVCMRKNMQGLVCCDDCKCDGTNTCDRKGCICVRIESFCKSVKTNCCENCDEKCKCSCVEQNTAIKAGNCAGKACGENCKCQENANSCVCICKNKQGETVCCDDCKCDKTNICDKKGCVCVLKEASCKGPPMKPNCCENCDVKCKCSCVDQEAVFNADACAGKVCIQNCKCQGNGNSCVCICMNKQGESICCVDCKCDNNNICDKKGCVCIRKESSCKCKSVKFSCCENCDENCKCCCVGIEPVTKTNNCHGRACSGNCKCQRNANCKCLGNANSCVCICKNKQGETICCEDCKCDDNNRCDKKGCACIPGASVSCNKKAEPKYCC